MSAGAERAAGIDDDCDGVARRVFPWWADPEATGLHAVVKRTPRILPPVRNVLCFDDVEADRRLFRVHSERAVELLDSVGEDMKEERELGLAADDDEALQRNALLSFSKKPSSPR